MPNTRRRPKAVAKQKLAATAKCKFNYLLGSVLPQHVKSNPPKKETGIHTEADLIAAAPALPLLILWEKSVVAEDGTVSQHPQVSINDFALDEFLNKHVDPASKIYGGVREQVKYYLWIQLMGDEAAAAHVQRQIAAKQEGDAPALLIEPAMLGIDPGFAVVEA